MHKFKETLKKKTPVICETCMIMKGTSRENLGGYRKRG